MAAGLDPSTHSVVVFHSPDTPLKRRKFVTPSSTSFADLVCIVRKQCELSASHTRGLVPHHTSLSDLCSRHADDDGILHIAVAREPRLRMTSPPLWPLLSLKIGDPPT